MSSRERILAQIRASLAHTRPALEAEARSAPHDPPPFVQPPLDHLPAQFAEELTKLEAHTYPVRDDEEALEAIRSIIESLQARSAVAWSLEQVGLPGLARLLSEVGVRLLDPHFAHAGAERATRLQALDPAAICISGVEAAIAESGTLVLLSGPGRPRLASLIAPVHIAVVRTHQLVRGLGEALRLVQERYGPDPLAESSNLVLITGPSRTADIEQTITRGVHGPGDVHVVLIG